MVEIKNLLVSFGDKVVLNHLNLQLAKGKIHGVLGMNGAGKTTLFRTLYGWYKANDGSLKFEGIDTDHNLIAFLETEPYFYPFINGWEYLQLIARKNPNFDLKAWNEVFDLPLEKPVSSYSTGMKKQLAFLGNLALEKPIMILDEPFNGVDMETSEKMMNIIQKLGKSGKTILISSHILPTLTGICDQIHLLTKGTVEVQYNQSEFSGLESKIKEDIEEKMGQQLEGLI